MSIPNVLAGRYASAQMRALWSPEEKIIAERRLWIAVLTAQRDLGVDFGGDDPDAVIAAYEGVVGPGRSRLHRRARARHASRREGADRGVQRPRRVRARAQGHDQPRPHGERRAGAGAGIVAPCQGADRDRPGLPLQARRDVRRSSPSPAARTTSRPRSRRSARGSRRRPTSCWSRTSASTRSSPVTRCAASRARSVRARTCSTCSAGMSPSWPSWRPAWLATSASSVRSPPPGRSTRGRWTSTS